MKNILENFYLQIKESQNLSGNLKIENKNVKNIVISGVGGSAFAGDILKSLFGEKINILINRDYLLPKFLAPNDTIIFIVSYSGNTEETIYAVKEAKKRKFEIIAISSNGFLEKFALKNKIKFVKVPGGIQPRNAIGYLLIPIIKILENSKIINEKQNIETLSKTIKINEKKIQIKAKKIAKLLYNKIPLIYSSEKLKCLSYGWKTRLNENSKIHAFSHQFPELNHNELVGYTKKIAPFFTILIQDKDDFQRIKKRYEITKKLILKLNGECLVLNTQGKTLLERIFLCLHLADWTTYYLALQYGIDPEPVKIIQTLKKSLKEKQI